MVRRGRVMLLLTGRLLPRANHEVRSFAFVLLSSINGRRGGRGGRGRRGSRRRALPLAFFFSMLLGLGLGLVLVLFLFSGLGLGLGLGGRFLNILSGQGGGLRGIEAA